MRDDLDTLVVDADLLEAIMGTPDPNRKAREVEIKVAKRLRNHLHDPRFKALGDRLEDLRNRHEQGVLLSVEFLKELLDLAWDLVGAEKAVPPIEEEDRGRQALTELFEEAKVAERPVIVERIVGEIDEIVRVERFEGWPGTHEGEREVKQALRKTLFHYKLDSDADLFDRAYGYICEYY